MKAVLCLAVAAIALHLGCVAVDAVPQRLQRRTARKARAQAQVDAGVGAADNSESASESGSDSVAGTGSKTFYGTSCAVAMLPALTWLNQATLLHFHNEAAVTDVHGVLGAAHNDLIKAQACGRKADDFLAHPDVSGGLAIAHNRHALWTALRACVSEYIDAQTLLFRNAHHTTLGHGDAHEHWAIGPNDAASGIVNGQLYTQREWQHVYGGLGPAAECSTTGAIGLPACRTNICHNDPATCSWAFSQVLTQWIPAGGGNVAIAEWARAGHRSGPVGAPNFESRELEHAAATLHIANGAHRPPNTGILADNVRWYTSRCTYTISTAGSQAMFTSLVNGCAVYTAVDAGTHDVMMIHANANGIGPAQMNIIAKERCAEQIRVNHNAVYGTNFQKSQRMTPAEYGLAAGKPVSIYGVKQPGGGHVWHWHVTKITAPANAVQHPEPAFVAWP